MFVFTQAICFLQTLSSFKLLATEKVLVKRLKVAEESFLNWNGTKERARGLWQ